MAGLVVIKFGGGLITKKTELCTPNLTAIQGLCCAVQELLEKQFQIIVVHGAGSYGHLKARNWKLAEGRDSSFVATEKMGVESQDSAIDSVRQDMSELNRLIVNGFSSIGISCSVYPPREWVRGVGPNFSGDLSRFFTTEDVDVTITFGDVVEITDEREFGILSGDDIVYRLATEEQVEHVIFAMNGAAGLMTKPPDEEGAELIDVWRVGDPVAQRHHQEIDVTGGIGLKLSRAGEISKNVDNVWLLDGNNPERIIEAIVQRSTIGTRILPSE